MWQNNKWFGGRALNTLERRSIMSAAANASDGRNVVGKPFRSPRAKEKTCLAPISHSLSLSLSPCHRFWALNKPGSRVYFHQNRNVLQCTVHSGSGYSTCYSQSVIMSEKESQAQNAVRALGRQSQV